MPRYSVALIGLGNVAEPHLLAYASLPSIEIVGVVEPRPARRGLICEMYHVAGFATADELLRDVHPDIACILTPAATHRALTEQFAKAGVNILCEKPMAVALSDAEAMATACREQGVEFFYGSSYRYLPAIRKARDLILNGAIGSVRCLMETVIAGAGATAFRPLSAEHYPTGGPGGGPMGLVDHGIHLLDIFPWLCGSPINNVCGRGDYSGSPALPEFTIMSMKSGALGFLTYDGSTWSVALPWEGSFSQARQWVDGRGWIGELGGWDPAAASLSVYGSLGALRIFHYANRLFLTNTMGCQEVPLETGAAPHHFGSQLLDFCNALTAGQPPPTRASDGIRALRALTAVYASERTGQWQTVEPSEGS